MVIFLFGVLVLSGPASAEAIPAKLEDIPFVPSDEHTEKRCIGDICQAIMYGGPPVFAYDKNRVLRNQTDVLSMVVNDTGIFLSDDKGNTAFGEIIITDDLSKEWKLKDYKDNEKGKDTSFNAYISKLTKEKEKAGHHFAIELSEKKSSLKSISINWTKTSSEFHIDYGDLRASNFTVFEKGNGNVDIFGFDSFGVPNSTFIDPVIFLGNESAIPRTGNGTWLDKGTPNGNSDDYCRIRGVSPNEACMFWFNWTSLGSIASFQNVTFYLSFSSGYSGTITHTITPVKNKGTTQQYTSVNTSTLPFPNGFWSPTPNANPCALTTFADADYNASCNTTSRPTFTVSADGIYGSDILNTVAVNNAGGFDSLLFYVFAPVSGSANSNQADAFSNGDAKKRPKLYLDYTLAGPPPSPPIESPLTWYNNSRTIFVNDSYRNLSVNITLLNVSNQGNFTQINTTDLKATRTIEALTFLENAVSLASKYLQLSGGTLTGTLISQLIKPSVDLTYDIGTNEFRFRNIWAQFINATGNITANRIYENGNRFPQPITCSGNNKIAVFNSDGTFTCQEDKIRLSIMTKLCDAKNCTVIDIQSGYNITVWAKGVYDGPANPQQVRLFQNTTLADQNQVDIQSTADADSFALIHYMTANNSNDITYIVNSTAGTLNNTKIMIQVAR